jgi:hypothetical protein
LSAPRDYAANDTVVVVNIVMLLTASRMDSVWDVEGALGRIAADANSDASFRGAETPWTPEEQNETLMMREVQADYPNPRSI